MNVDRFVFLFAGLMVLASVALGYFISPWWLLLGVFVGLNMTQASITAFCPLAMILKRLGVKPGQAFR